MEHLSVCLHGCPHLKPSTLSSHWHLLLFLFEDTDGVFWRASFISPELFQTLLLARSLSLKTWNNGNIEKSNSHLFLPSTTSSFPPTCTAYCPCGGGCNTNPGRELHDWLCPSEPHRVVKRLVNTMHSATHRSFSLVSRSCSLYSQTVTYLRSIYCYT